MDKQRKPVNSRAFGSNRWKQERGTRRDGQISSVSGEESFSSEIMEKILDIFQELDENKKGFLTRADLQKLEADLPWSKEELELVFDGLDSDSNGYLTIEEFTAGLRHFLSSQTATRQNRKRKMASGKVPLNLSLEEAEYEEQKCFETFINQLGANYIFEDQSEIWKIWVQLRQDEPDLLGNLKEFLAKTTCLIKEAKHEKEKLQLILKTQVADHNKEVQQLYEEMEQQIEREKQRLQHESETRSHSHSMEMKEVLDAREKEIQNFLAVQKELETQCFNLKENQHMASTQNQQLKQTNTALEKQLQQTLHKLQETQRHVDTMKSRISQIHQEEEGGLVHLQRQHKHVYGKGDCDTSSKTPQRPQDPLNEHEMICCELETKFDYGPCEDTLESSAQQTSDDMTSVNKADLSESRTRVISIEEDPLAESFLEQPHFLQEALGQKSLFKELSDAIAALVKVPESQKQQTNNLSFKEHKSLLQTRQNGDSQQSILQAEMPECRTLLRNMDIQKGISETLPNQATSQEDLLQGGQTHTQVNTLKMMKTKSFESRVKVRTPERVQRGSLAPEIQSSIYSEMIKHVSVYKKVPVEGDILVLGNVIQPEHHMQVLQCRDTIQAHGQPADYEKEKPPEMKTSDTQHSPMKDVPPAHFPARIVSPKLCEEFKPETSLLVNSQSETVSNTEGQMQTTEGFEVSFAEDRGGETMPNCEKTQEVRAEMVKEKNLKSEAQENLAAKENSGGATDVCCHPDHLYNVLFVGDSNVGKTAFLHRLHSNSFEANMTATVGMDYRIKNFFVDNKCFALQLWDTAGQERYHSLTKQFFRKADGVVLMYDITSEYSFANMRYWLSCIQEGAGNGVVILPLGNKTDCIAERRVSTEDGEYLAKEYGLSFYECSAASGHNVLESMVTLVRLLQMRWGTGINKTQVELEVKFQFWAQKLYRFYRMEQVNKISSWLAIINGQLSRITNRAVEKLF